jgi:hypothetical protein
MSSTAELAPGEGHEGAEGSRPVAPAGTWETPGPEKKVVFALLLVLRLVNALALRTFFQPDEYFQALEPAWNIAFGPDSGAWLTWVTDRLHYPF